MVRSAERRVGHQAEAVLEDRVPTWAVCNFMAPAGVTRSVLHTESAKVSPQHQFCTMSRRACWLCTAGCSVQDWGYDARPWARCTWGEAPWWYLGGPRPHHAQNPCFAPFLQHTFHGVRASDFQKVQNWLRIGKVFQDLGNPLKPVSKSGQF